MLLQLAALFAPRYPGPGFTMHPTASEAREPTRGASLQEWTLLSVNGI